MKTVALFVALFAVAMAAPQYRQQDVIVTKENLHNNIGVEGYNYGYELSDGQTRQEQAEFIAPRSANEEGTMRVTGSYSWVDPADGRTYLVRYVADENGFRAEGDHLPVAPVA
ncbi:larval cuticle protein 8-like [Trichogramma pretiosum]|uniref:larval cuticle protein 8-like n=1 Tax=Trichogramma pretiosum TaxID=7493 RepID=UPI0006C98722|nr:larval cuticle protein 8-like [Trichogramma pretiosum]